MSAAPATLPPQTAPLPRRRIASIAVGQTPRGEVLADVLASLPVPVEVEEFGALDGLSAAEIRALAPRRGERSLVTRLRDGRNVVVSKPRVATRMEAICRTIERERFDLLVILSTGLFRDFESPCPTVNAQRAMEAAIAAVAAAGQAVGVVYPLRRQVEENKDHWVPGFSLRFTHAESAEPAVLRRAADALAGCDFLVLNSVGFSEADRQVVARQSGKPVILARRVVAGAIRLLLDPGIRLASSRPAGPSAFDARFSHLTRRERQVLSLVAEGLGNKAIGRQLAISPRTVEVHRANMMQKVGASSVGALIRLVLEAQHAAV